MPNVNSVKHDQNTANKRIAVVGQPSWLPELARVSVKYHYQVQEIADSSAIASFDALLIDYNHDDLRAIVEQRVRWAVALTNDADYLAAAYESIGEAWLVNQLDMMLPRLLAAQDRIADEHVMQQLRLQAAQPLPAMGVEGVQQFNAGEYYHQHDLFEALWMQEEGPIRELYRAILQVGVAYYHAQRGNVRGAIKLLLRASQWLTPMPERCQGIDVAQLRTDAAMARFALAVHVQSGEAVFDTTRFMGLSYTQNVVD